MLDPLDLDTALRRICLLLMECAIQFLNHWSPHVDDRGNGHHLAYQCPQRLDRDHVAKCLRDEMHNLNHLGLRHPSSPVKLSCTPIHVALCASIAVWNARGTPSIIQPIETIAASLFRWPLLPMNIPSGSSTYTCRSAWDRLGLSSGPIISNRMNLDIIAIITENVSGAARGPWAARSKT